MYLFHCLWSLKIVELLRNPAVIFYMLCNNFFYVLLSFVFHLQKDFFLLFKTTLKLFFFLFLRKILIPFTSLFSKSFFVFLGVSGWHSYICEKKYLIDFSYTKHHFKLLKITCNHLKWLKNHLNYSKHIFLFFFCFFCKYMKMENSTHANYKTKLRQNT